jgi:hypothetical protein
MYLVLSEFTSSVISVLAATLFVCFFCVIPRRPTPGNYPKESIQHLEQGERLKSRSYCIFVFSFIVITFPPIIL